LPRPNGKKYSREHIIRLMYIFMLKQVLSLQDIRRMFELLETDIGVESMYGTYLEMVEDFKRQQRSNLISRMERVEEKLVEKGIYTDEHFELMLMLLTVTEATAGKMLIERLIDELAEQRKQEKEPNREKK
jgi:hypothetical protein